MVAVCFQVDLVVSRPAIPAVVGGLGTTETSWGVVHPTDKLKPGNDRGQKHTVHVAYSL